MDARRRALADEADELTGRVATASHAADEAAVAAATAEAAFAAVAHLRERNVDPELLGRLVEIATGLETMLGRARDAATRLEEPLAARLTIGSQQAGELGAELRRLSALEADAARDASDAVARAQAAEVVVARLGGSLDELPPEDSTPREHLVAEASSLLALAEAAAAEARTAADWARDADAALLERAPRRSALDPDMLGRLLDAVGALGAGLQRAGLIAARLEAPVRARVDAGAERSTRLGEELRRLGAEEVAVRQQSDEANERATQVQVDLARLEAEAEEAQRRLDDAGAVEPAEGDDRTELAVRTERLDARREALGKVNPLAKEEYEEEKARLEELAAQRLDLETSLAEIAKLRDELAETVERRFNETFEAVAAHFEEVSATLFPGGEGRLRLVEPDDDGEGGELEAGVEVELRPAGKRITRLTLLSGGEKALGAISFLFALFLAKPCPFYLLDEVEAALDDTNVTRFVELLRRYSDRAQFIVITHQKRTMEAADVLYGVTMGGDGVSQVVSRRLPQHDHAAATA
jgi:chromosome segregation protein